MRPRRAGRRHAHRGPGAFGPAAGNGSAALRGTDRRLLGERPAPVPADAGVAERGAVGRDDADRPGDVVPPARRPSAAGGGPTADDGRTSRGAAIATASGPARRRGGVGRRTPTVAANTRADRGAPGTDGAGRGRRERRVAA